MNNMYVSFIKYRKFNLMMIAVLVISTSAISSSSQHRNYYPTGSVAYRVLGPSYFGIDRGNVSHWFQVRADVELLGEIREGALYPSAVGQASFPFVTHMSSQPFFQSTGSLSDVIYDQQYTTGSGIQAITWRYNYSLSRYVEINMSGSDMFYLELRSCGGIPVGNII